MSLSLSEIDALLALARMELPSAEKVALHKDVESIIGYVDQLKGAVATMPKEGLPYVRNIVREDVVTTESGTFSDALVKAAPESDGRFVKVKKIL